MLQRAGGRVYTGVEAVKAGLVDEIGTMNDALEFVLSQLPSDFYKVACSHPHL